MHIIITQISNDIKEIKLSNVMQTRYFNCMSDTCRRFIHFLNVIDLLRKCLIELHSYMVLKKYKSEMYNV